MKNYGLFELEGAQSAIVAQQNVPKLGDSDIVWGIKETIKRAGIKAVDAIASIPAYSTFATIISLPYLSKEDIAKAVPFEARKYVPIPLNDVNLAWSIIDVGDQLEQQTNSSSPPIVEVFLAAVSKDETRRYQNIMREAGLTLRALELENISLVRSLIGNDRSPVALVNAGGRSTSISVVDNGFQRMNRNYEIGGFEVTKSISRSLGVDIKRAEELKRSVGLKDNESKIINEAMMSLIDMMIFETRKTISTYESDKKTKVNKVILIGGLANMPHFAEYFKNKIGVNVEIGNPFARVVAPPPVHNLLPQLGATFAVALGLAMREV